jgi:hypothetical protein
MKDIYLAESIIEENRELIGNVAKNGW